MASATAATARHDVRASFVSRAVIRRADYSATYNCCAASPNFSASVSFSSISLLSASFSAMACTTVKASARESQMELPLDTTKHSAASIGVSALAEHE